MKRQSVRKAQVQKMQKHLLGDDCAHVVALLEARLILLLVVVELHAHIHSSKAGPAKADEAGLLTLLLTHVGGKEGPLVSQEVVEAVLTLREGHQKAGVHDIVTQLPHRRESVGLAVHLNLLEVKVALKALKLKAHTILGHVDGLEMHQCTLALKLVPHSMRLDAPQLCIHTHVMLQAYTHMHTLHGISWHGTHTVRGVLVATGLLLLGRGGCSIIIGEPLAGELAVLVGRHGNVCGT